MNLKIIHTTKLCTVLFCVFILHPDLSVCQNADKNERPKRTVGFLFRSFVNAFQTQRQPEPMVHSYQPLKQTNQPAASQSTLHSTKADLLASSKNIFEQKKNLLKPPSTRGQELDLIKQLIQTNPTPNPATQIQPQSEPYRSNSLHGPPPTQVSPTFPSHFATHSTLPNFHSHNIPPQAQPLQNVPTDPYGAQYQSVPLNSSPGNQLSPISHVIPSSNHHPSVPLKAQIFILPFVEDHAAAAPGASFPGFNPEASPPVVPSPINYQAEIYLPPSATRTTGNHHSARFSVSNGWRDIDDIISRGNQQPLGKKEEKQYIENNSGIKPEITSYNPATALEETSTKHPVKHTSEIENGNQENHIPEFNKYTQIYYENHVHNSARPLFVPQVQQSTPYNPESYQNANGAVDRSFQMDPTFYQDKFEHSVEQTYSYQTQNLEDPQSMQRERQHLNDNKYFLNYLDPESKFSRTSHDYEPSQRESEEECGEHYIIKSNYDQTNNLNAESGYQNVHPHIQDNLFDVIQYPSKVGRLPEFLTKY